MGCGGPKRQDPVVLVSWVRRTPVRLIYIEGTLLFTGTTHRRSVLWPKVLFWQPTSHLWVALHEGKFQDFCRNPFASSREGTFPEETSFPSTATAGVETIPRSRISFMSVTFSRMIVLLSCWAALSIISNVRLHLGQPEPKISTFKGHTSFLFEIFTRSRTPNPKPWKRR